MITIKPKIEWNSEIKKYEYVGPFCEKVKKMNDSGTSCSDIVQEKNDYLGFYLCYNGNVTKLNHPTNANTNYHIDYIISYAMQVSQVLFQNVADIDVMIYSCIGYQNANQMTTVFPKVC